MSLNPVETLCQLVAIPSVNPMGRDVAGPEYLETRLTQWLEQCFRQLGLPYERQFVAPERDNILCRLDGRPDQLLLLEVHQDTVPVDGMTIPPFEPTVREGRVYGRGACDVKGGMAAMLAALARLVDERPAEMPTIILACTINEEFGFSGAMRLTELWQPGTASLFPRPPDAAIVAEPTLLNVVVAHKGAVRWICHARGHAAHSSQPDQGRNAIYSASRVALAIEKYHAEVLPTIPEHPLCGRPTAAATMISGGISPNTIPDHCALEIERRLLPGEDPDEIYQQMIDYVREQTEHQQGLDHEPPHGSSRGLGHEANEVLAQQLATVARELEPACDLIGVPYGTDASVISMAGVPTVVFGPGSIAQAHTADEWLAVDQLQRASEIYYQFAKRGLSQ